MTKIDPIRNGKPKYSPLNNGIGRPGILPQKKRPRDFTDDF